MDVELVQRLFVEGRDAPPLAIAQNMPRVVGALFWGRGLRQRVDHPVDKLRELGESILERSESKELMKLYGALASSLSEFEGQKVEEWGRDIDSASQAKLHQPLLVRDGRVLSVNFDKVLLKLLREVKYFILLDIAVPASALDIITRAETFRQQTGNLELLCDRYNEMVRTMLPVDRSQSLTAPSSLPLASIELPTVASTATAPQCAVPRSLQ